MAVPICHTPIPLKRIAPHALTSGLLEKCRPDIILDSYRDIITETTGTNRIDVDKVILYSIEDFHNPKTKLILYLKSLKEWWHGVNCVASLPILLQKQVLNSFLPALDEREDFSLMYKFLLQILFANDAGGILPFHLREEGVNLLVMSQADWTSFALLLELLAPFHLEGINTGLVEFSDPLPFVTILKNCPNLKTVKLYRVSNNSNILFRLIGSYCPNLELVMVNIWDIISNNCLYATFFGGMDKDTVLQHLATNKPVPISFPKLKWIHMELKFTMPHNHFLQVLLHFYPNLQCVLPLYMYRGCLPTDVLHPPDEEIIWTSPRSPCNLKAVTLKEYCLAPQAIDKIVKLCPQVEHLNLNDEEQLEFESPEAVAKTIKLLAEKLNITCLSLCTTAESLGVYLPTFSEIGPSLKELNLTLIYKAGAELLCELINKCPNLESLKISRRLKYIFGRGNQTLHSLSKLSTLSVWDPFEDTRSSHSCVQYLVQCAPNICTLEIGIRDVSMISEIVKQGGLHNLQTLILIGELYGIQVEFVSFHDRLQHRLNDRNNVVEIIKRLPSLRTLVLYMPWEPDFSYYLNVYKHTALTVIHGITLFERTTTQCLLAF